MDSESYAAIKNSDSVNAVLTMNSTLEVERVGFKYFSLIIGILFIVFIGITCLCIKEKSSVDMETPSVKQMFKALLGNDQAMTIVITIVLFNTATYITSNLLIYFFKYDFGTTGWNSAYVLFNMFGGAIQVLSMMVFYPLLRSQTTGKKAIGMCLLIMLGTALIGGIYFALSQGFRVPVFFYGFGYGLVGGLLLAVLFFFLMRSKPLSSLRVFYLCLTMAVIGYAVLLILAFTNMSSVFLLSRKTQVESPVIL